MKRRDSKDYLRDILDAIDNVENFVGDMTYSQFTKDRKTFHAVVRCMEIIGEASKNIPQRVKTEQEALPWKQMAAMRDKLTHAYFGVDEETIWKTIKEDIPSLKEPISKLLEEQEHGTP